MSRVLLVEDEVVIRTALRVSLAAAGHQVAEAGDARTALIEVGRTPPDAVLLDLGLPDLDGVALLPQLRARTGAPVIVLTARDDRASTVAALDAGADDFVTKPFDTEVLLARLRAVIRRSEPDPADDRAGADAPVVAGDLVIDLGARSVRRGGEPIALTRTERLLLEALARHPGVLRTHAELLQEVWGPAYGRETTYLRTFVRQLRAKLGDDADHPRYIATEPGLGYRWVAGVRAR